MIPRVLRTSDLRDADELERDAWAKATPLERLAAVEVIRQATFALYGSSVSGLERVLEVADAPSSAVRPRGPKDIADIVALTGTFPQPRKPRSPKPAKPTRRTARKPKR